MTVINRNYFYLFSILIVAGLVTFLVWKFPVFRILGLVFQFQWIAVHILLNSNKLCIFYTTYFLYYCPIIAILNLFFIKVDFTGRPSFVHNRKIQNSHDVQLNYKQLKDCAFVCVLNCFIITPIFMYFYYFAMTWRGINFSTSFPSFWTALWQFAIFICFQEVLGYYLHRFVLHHSSIYKYIHRKHHEHEMSVSLTLFYRNPLDHLLQNILPVYVGPLFLGPHFLTFLAWVIFAGCLGTCVHSGYRFQFWSLAEHHKFHQLHGYGNYSSLQILDKLHGTKFQYHHHPVVNVETQDGKVSNG